MTDNRNQTDAPNSPKSTAPEPNTHWYSISPTLARCQHNHLFNHTVNNHCPFCRTPEIATHD